MANPPTLLFTVEKFLEDLEEVPPESRGATSEFRVLKKNYGRLKRWMQWIRATQRNREGFPMWKGRSAGHNLASGLDDYPRGLQVNESERHLDLYMWEYMFCKIMIKLSEFLGESEDSIIFRRDLEGLMEISQGFVHEGRLSDYLGEQYVNKEGIQAYVWRGDQKCKSVSSPLGSPAECNPYSEYPCCSEFGWCGNTPDHCNCEKCSRAQPLEKRKGLQMKELYSPHIGYVSLMPFIVGYVKPGTSEFEKIMEFIHSPRYLWTQFGVRSLSKGDLLFKTGENYWRGEIWINFNFLVLRAMKKFYWGEENIRQVYKELRQNILKTVVNGWEKTGYVWEQYNEDIGNGQRVHPFTGWSTLVLNIIHEHF